MVRQGVLVLALLAALSPTASSQPETPQIPANISIEGTPEFVAQAERALERILATPVGREVVGAIGAAPHATTITELDQPNGFSRAHSADANRTADGPGPGSDTTIGWNPNYAPGVPVEVILAHELIHTLHAMQGMRDPVILDDPGNPDHEIRQEELRTVGVEGFDDGPTENAFRESWNATYGTDLPERVTYRGPVRTGILPEHRRASGGTTSNKPAGSRKPAAGKTGPPTTGGKGARGARGALIDMMGR